MEGENALFSGIVLVPFKILFFGMGLFMSYIAVAVIAKLAESYGINAILTTLLGRATGIVAWTSYIALVLLVIWFIIKAFDLLQSLVKLR